jgi:tetratricopeptide (TPR) repeat protein
MPTEQPQDGHHLADLIWTYHHYRADFLAFAQAYPVAEAERLLAYRQSAIAWYEAQLREGADFPFETLYYLQEAGTYYLTPHAQEPLTSKLPDPTGPHPMREFLPIRQELSNEQVAMQTQLLELGDTCRKLLILSYYHHLSDTRLAAVLQVPEAERGVARKRMQCVLMVNERLRNSGLTGKDQFVMDADEALLDRFFRSGMTEAQTEQLYRRRQAEPRLGLAFRRWEQWLEVVRATGRRELNDLLQEEERRYARQARPSVRGRLAGWPSWVTTAVLLILIGVIAYGLVGPPPERVLIERYFSLYPNVIVPTDDVNEPPDKYLAGAFLAYDAGDYAAAYREFADLLPVYPASRLYLGICALGQEQYARAIDWFEEIAPGEPYYAAAEWYLALALIGNDDEVAALGLLSRIAETASHPFQRQSRALLADLR